MGVFHGRSRSSQAHLAAAFSRWSAGTDHFRSHRRKSYRYGARRPLLRDCRGAPEHLAMDSRPKGERQVSLEGNDKMRIASGEELGTGTWAPDSFHLSFFGLGTNIEH